AGRSGEVVLPTVDGTPATFGVAAAPVPRDEDRLFAVRWEQGDALAAVCEGDYARGEEILARWGRWLYEHKVLHHWFEMRLRLIACHRLAGRKEKMEPLARQLEDKAWKARDWLTLRRLGRLFDASAPPEPLALLAPLDSGPFT